MPLPVLTLAKLALVSAPFMVPGEPGLYTATQGDTLFKIAQANGIPFSKLVAWNPELKDRALWVGDKVRLKPGAQSRESLRVAKQKDALVGIAPEESLPGTPAEAPVAVPAPRNLHVPPTVVAATAPRAAASAPEEGPKRETSEAADVVVKVARSGEGRAEPSLPPLHAEPRTLAVAKAPAPPPAGVAMPNDLSGAPISADSYFFRGSTPGGADFQPYPWDEFRALPTVDATYRPRSAWRETQLLVARSLEAKSVMMQGYVRGIAPVRGDSTLAFVVCQGPQDQVADGILVRLPLQRLPKDIRNSLSVLEQAMKGKQQIQIEGWPAYDPTAKVPHRSGGPWFLVAYTTRTAVDVNSDWVSLD